MTPPRNALLDQVTSEARLRRRPALQKAAALTLGRPDRNELLARLVGALEHGGCGFGEAWRAVGAAYVAAEAEARIREAFPGTKAAS